MRKINLLLAIAAFFSFSFLASCDATDPENVDPLLTLATSGLGANNTITEGTIFTVTVTGAENPDSKSKLDELVIVKPGVDTTITINASSYNSTFTYDAPAAGQTATYTFTLTDKDGVSASQSIDVTGEAAVTTTPLGAATTFSMARCGSNNNPEAFGLEFSNVTGSSPNFTAVVVTSTADKMVQLTAGEWSSITTVEDLTAAVDAGTGITQITMPVGGAVDIVVATKEGSTYTLINFTDAAGPVPCAAGSEITLSGESKQ